MLTDRHIIDFISKKIGKTPTVIIQPSHSLAEFHDVYFVQFDDNIKNDLVLRVTKQNTVAQTQMEVAFMKWVRQNLKKCPVPDVVAWDVSYGGGADLFSDYTLLTRVKGVTLGSVWEKCDMNKIISQIAEIYVEMAHHKLPKMGGLLSPKDERDGDASPTTALSFGPWIEETTYSMLEYKQFFDKKGSFTFDQLQVGGPFDTVTDYVNARLKRDLMIMEAHESCQALAQSGFYSKLEELEKLVATKPDKLNDTPYCVHHNDMHLGNIMVDESTSTITGLIDWELATIAPIDQWIRRNTLYWDNVDPTQITAWVVQLREKVRELDPSIPTKTTDIKEKMLQLVSLSFWIVKCTVMGTQKEDVVSWIERFNRTCEVFRDL